MFEYLIRKKKNLHFFVHSFRKMNNIFRGSNYIVYRIRKSIRVFALFVIVFASNKLTSNFIFRMCASIKIVIFHSKYEMQIMSASALSQTEEREQRKRRKKKSCLSLFTCLTKFRNGEECSQ